jgi:hypothetical protein
MQKSPFKFLDSFTREDRDIFFGRDKEIEELYSRVFESKILLVYGTSGTGKSSLINCGLSNKFNVSDWLPVSVRRGTNINQNLFDALARNALTKAPFEKINKDGSRQISLLKALQSIYLDHFKPVYLIFDQFEELFIFGNKEEKDELINSIKKVYDSDIQCRLIFSMREEYLAGVTEFEKVIPTFLSNRIRIEKMTRQNAIQAIEGPCRVNGIAVEEGFSEALLQKLNPDSPEVELTFLQVFLDKVYKLAGGGETTVNKITTGLIDKLGDVKDLLGTFLDEQISQLNEPETGLVILKSFVSVKGTKHQITEKEVIEYTKTFGKNIDHDTIISLIQRFIKLRILRDKDENDRYELRHDSLASKIYEKITLLEKELLEIRYFIENAFGNYEKRQLLLSSEDLKYIAPYEDKLYLNEKILRFISQSKREFHKAKRRRQNFLVVVVAIVIVVLSFFTIWAMRERSNAIVQQQNAEEQKNSAVKAKEEADRAKQDAIDSRKKAEENEKVATEAKNQSEQARKEAIKAKENADQQRILAEKLSAIAKDQASIAEREKMVADSQRVIAQVAGDKARKLGLLSTAQNLALKSVLLEKNPELMGLLAIQAYTFNKNNGGQADDPIIYEALNKAYTILDSSRHSVFTGSQNEVRALAENPIGLLSADIDGTILSWSKDGKYKYISNNTPSHFVDYISISPSGDKVITGYENNILEIRDIEKDNTANHELTGHKDRVSSSAFSINKDYLATAGDDSLIIIRNVKQAGISEVKKIKTGAKVRSVVFCGRDTIISAQEDGEIVLWSAGSTLSRILFQAGSEKPVCLAWNGTKRTLLAGCSNGTLLLFDLTMSESSAPRKYAVHSAGIDQIAFNSDFSLLATGCWDKTIKLYNYHTFFELSNTVGGGIQLKSLNGRTRSLIFTKDNKLVAGLSDKSIRIWETSSQKLALLICDLVKRDMTISEWNEMIGALIPYENPCRKSQ